MGYKIAGPMFWDEDVKEAWDALFLFVLIFIEGDVVLKIKTLKDLVFGFLSQNHTFASADCYSYLCANV